jgi:hypothetical protein
VKRTGQGKLETHTAYVQIAQYLLRMIANIRSLMNKLLAGQICPDAHNIGKHVFATRIVETNFLPNTSAKQKPYHTAGTYTCPVCGAESDTFVWVEDVWVRGWYEKGSYCTYCSSCYTAFRSEQIGVLDDEGNYNEI